MTAANLSLAKGLAAERARTVLEDPKSEHSLARLCDCGKKMVIDLGPPIIEAEVEDKPEVLITDETEEGFAKLADQARIEFEDQDIENPLIALVDDSHSDNDEQAVEDMLAIYDKDPEIGD